MVVWGVEGRRDVRGQHDSPLFSLQSIHSYFKSVGASRSTSLPLQVPTRRGRQDKHHPSTHKDTQRQDAPVIEGWSQRGRGVLPKTTLNAHPSHTKCDTLQHAQDKARTSHDTSLDFTLHIQSVSECAVPDLISQKEQNELAEPHLLVWSLVLVPSWHICQKWVVH